MPWIAAARSALSREITFFSAARRKNSSREMAFLAILGFAADVERSGIQLHMASDAIAVKGEFAHRDKAVKAAGMAGLAGWRSGKIDLPDRKKGMAEGAAAKRGIVHLVMAGGTGSVQGLVLARQGVVPAVTGRTGNGRFSTPLMMTRRAVGDVLMLLMVEDVPCLPCRVMADAALIVGKWICLMNGNKCITEAGWMTCRTWRGIRFRCGGVVAGRAFDPGNVLMGCVGKNNRARGVGQKKSNRSFRGRGWEEVPSNAYCEEQEKNAEAERKRRNGRTSRRWKKSQRGRDSRFGYILQKGRHSFCFRGKLVNSCSSGYFSGLCLRSGAAQQRSLPDASDIDRRFHGSP